MGLPIIQNSTILLLKIIVLGIPPQSNVVCLLLLQGHRDDMGWPMGLSKCSHWCCEERVLNLIIVFWRMGTVIRFTVSLGTPVGIGPRLRLRIVSFQPTITQRRRLFFGVIWRAWAVQPAIGVMEHHAEQLGFWTHHPTCLSGRQKRVVRTPLCAEFWSQFLPLASKQLQLLSCKKSVS